jgi:hypothetical protein
MTGPELDQALETAASEVRLTSRKSYGRLWEAYVIAGNLLFRQVAQGTTEVLSVSESQSLRLSLTANLIQSSTVVEHLISSSYYWTATAVLRQHMEVLARIIEIRDGKIVKTASTPNVKHLPFKLAGNYGRLSELCHVSKGEFLAEFAQSPAGEDAASPKPYYRDEWAKELLSIHIAHMLALAIEVYFLQEELYPERELLDVSDPVEKIAQILISAGFWEEISTQEEMEQLAKSK